VQVIQGCLGISRVKAGALLVQQHALNHVKRVAAGRVGVSVALESAELQLNAWPACAQPGQRIVPDILVAGLIREARLGRQKLSDAWRHQDHLGCAVASSFVCPCSSLR